MPRNSSGTYTLPAGNPVVTGTLIESTWANPTMSDIGSSITDSLDRFGRGGMLAPLRFVDGTVSAPGISFSSETTMGLYRPSSGTLAIAIGAVARMTMTASLFTIVPPTTFTGLVTLNGGANIGGTVDINNLTNNTAQAFETSTSVTPDWQMVGTSTAANSFMGWSRFAAITSGPALYLGHSRGTTVGAQTIIQNGDQFAQISFFGSDGVSFREGARIVAESDGTPGVADMPGRLRLMVTPDGGATPVEAVRISQTGAALFAAALSVTGTLVALSNATVATTLDVAGHTNLQTTAVIGATGAIPTNTRVLIDRLSVSPLPALSSGTVLTLAGSTAASSPAHLQFISGNTGSSVIFFGDTDAADRGRVAYAHSTDALSFSTAGALALTINSAGDVLPANALSLPSGSAAAPSLNFASSTTTGLYRVGADNIGISTAGALRFAIDSSGRLIGGGNTAANTTRVSTSNVTPGIQTYGGTSAAASFGAFIFENGTAGASAYYLLGRGRGATGAPLIVANGDSIGRFSAAGYDGAQFTEGARISFIVDGTPGANDMPTRIEFLTTPDAGLAPTLALSLASDSTATFTGSIVGTTAALTASGTTTLVSLNRTGSSVNCEISFQTTSGTVFVGQGAANTFAVGGASSLNTTAWFNVTSTAATFNTNGSFDGTLTNTGTARFSGATQGFLGVRESTGSGATVNGNADSIVIDSSGNGGLSILTPNTAVGAIYFGDPEGALQGRVTYTHSSDTMSIVAGAATVLTLTNSVITLGSSEDLVLDGVGPTSTLSAGFRGIPQNSKSAAYTLVLSDAGRHIYHPSADTTARTWTIPANSSVAFPIGTAVTFVNDSSAGTITISITTDTLVLAGAGSTGSRTLAANGVATAVKMTATRWMISGTGLT